MLGTAALRRARAGATVLGAAAVLGATLIPLTTATPAAADEPGAILFEDDFNGAAGASFDTTKWEDHSGCSYDNTGFFGSIQCGNNETLNGQGQLQLPGTPTTGSALRTKNFGFVYGEMSAWMKMPSEPGYWPAFWTLNNNRTGGAATVSRPVGEIDTVEAYTTWNNVYQAAGHVWTGNGATDYHSQGHRCPQPETADLSGKFNKFTARVEPGKITYFFNDVQCGEPWVKDPNKPWAFGPDLMAENWLILQNAVGGAGGQQTPASAPANVLVDRVEVRALPTTTTPAPAPATPVAGSTYEFSNACGGQLLEAPSTDVSWLRTGTDVNGALQRWTLVATTDGHVKLRNATANKVANVGYASTADGAGVLLYGDSGGTNAEWKLTANADGTYSVKARHSGKPLDVKGDVATAGAAVEQRTADASCGQKWTLTKV